MPDPGQGGMAVDSAFIAPQGGAPAPGSLTDLNAAEGKKVAQDYQNTAGPKKQNPEAKKMQETVGGVGSSLAQQASAKLQETFNMIFDHAKETMLQPEMPKAPQQAQPVPLSMNQPNQMPNPQGAWAPGAMGQQVAMSDRQTKKNITSANNSLRDFLDSLNGKR